MRQLMISRQVVWLAVLLVITAIMPRSNTIGRPPTAAEITTPSGLRYFDVVVGAGPTPRPGDWVTVQYIGHLTNGHEFYSTYRGYGGLKAAPAYLPVGVQKIISGLDEGLLTMRVGGRRHLIIPPNLAYGNHRMGDRIPANSTLVYDAKLLSLSRQAPPVLRH